MPALTSPVAQLVSGAMKYRVYHAFNQQTCCNKKPCYLKKLTTVVRSPNKTCGALVATHSVTNLADGRG